MFLEKPIFGFGLGGYNQYCTNYGSPLHIEAHNTYIQVLVEYGIFGLGLFIFCIFNSITAYTRYIKHSNSPELVATAAGFLCALIAILIDSSVHCFEWNLNLWLPLSMGYIFHSLKRREILNNNDTVEFSSLSETVSLR